MAFVFSYFVVALTVVDREGDETTRRFRMIDTITDPGDAADAADALIAAFANMSYGHIAKYSLESVYSEDAFSLPTDAAAQNFNQALLVYQLDGLPIHKGTQSIPQPQQGIFAAASGPNGKIVDLADAAVIAWRSLFQNDAGFTVSDGEQVDTLLSGHRRSTKSSSGN